ncbi:MAG: hypothetical protein ACI82A_002305 [Candidatus Azotimanducaceae bacterium]|jgi:hypothetical protein
MDYRYIEYHQIVESFVLGQLVEVVQPSAEECPECQLQLRMKQAFIKVLREEMPE